MTEKRVKANEKQKKSVRTVMKELFNVTSASDDDDAIMRSFLGYASNLKNDLEKLDIHYATQPAYPGKQLIASGKKLMADVLQMKYSNEFFAGIDHKKDDFLDFAEDYEPVKKFFAGEQKGMEFYDVNFSYIDNETFEEFYVSVPEQGGGKLIPEGMCNPGQVYTVAQGKTGMLGVFRLESQMMPGNGKFERSGLGSDGKCKEATNTAFNFLKANSNRISGSISTTTKDYIINYQDLQGIGMTDKLALPTLIALSSVALGKPVASSLAVLGEISIAGTLIKVDELANSLQVCLDSGAKKVLLPIVSAADIGAVPSDLIGCFNLIFYSSAEDAVYKALGVE